MPKGYTPRHVKLARFRAERRARIDRQLATLDVTQPLRDQVASPAEISSRRVSTVGVSQALASGNVEKIASSFDPADFSRDWNLSTSQRNRSDGSLSGAADPAKQLSRTQINLESIEDLALESHPALAEALDEVRELRRSGLQSGSLKNAQVSFAEGQAADPKETSQVGKLLNQSQQAAVQGDDQRAAQRRAIEAAQLRVERARLEVKSKVRRAYYQLGIAQRRAVLTRAMEDAAEENVQLSRAKLNEQKYSKVDLLRARVQSKRLATARQNAEADLAAAIVRLQATVNSPRVNFDDEAIRQKIADQLPQGDELKVANDAEAWSSRHPDLAEAARDVELELAGAEKRGDIEPRRLQSESTASVSVASTTPSRAQQRYRRIELELDRRYASAMAAFEKGRAQVERYNQPGGILDLSQESVELLRNQVDTGDCDPLELALAIRDAMESELESISALGETLDQKARIETLLVEDAS